MGLASHALLLVALAGGLANLDRRTSLDSMISQPMVAGFMVGAFLGEPELGFLFGSVFQMVLLGVVSIRGSMLPDFSAGSVIGAAVFTGVITVSAGDPSTRGFAYFVSFIAAVVSSMIFGALYRWWERRSSFLADVCISLLRSGRGWGVSVVHLSTIVLHFLVGAVYCSVFTAALMWVAGSTVHSPGVGLFSPLSSLEVILPFIGLGFLLGHFTSRIRAFWFATGFVVALVFIVTVG